MKFAWSRLLVGALVAGAWLAPSRAVAQAEALEREDRVSDQAAGSTGWLPLWMSRLPERLSGRQKPGAMSDIEFNI